MRYVFELVGVLALSLMLSVGCSDNGGDGGSGGSGGTGGITGQEFPCTEQGIRDAITLGGGPHTFDCDGPTTVVTEAEIVIDNDVILDGEGSLIVDGSQLCQVIVSLTSEAAELRNLTIGPAWGEGCDSKDARGAIVVPASSALTLTGVEVSPANSNWDILSNGVLTLRETTLSGFLETDGLATITKSTVGDIYASNELMMQNSTVTGSFTISSGTRPSRAVLTNCTLVSGEGVALRVTGATGTASVRAAGTIIMGGCEIRGTLASDGFNIESEGDTCGFDQPTDLVNVSADDLALGPLNGNGGSTQTHALLPGSVAIDKIPEVDCVDADGAPLTTDQRGQPRPETGGTMCDVGAFEWSARDVALASYCAAVLECFPDDESCDTVFANLLWVGEGGDFAACTSAKLEVVECVVSLDCDQLGQGSEIVGECTAQVGAWFQACEIPVK